MFVILFLPLGNANPRFIRSTMYNIPCTSDMIKSSHIPFAISVTPFAQVGPQEVSGMRFVHVVCPFHPAE